MRIPVLVAKKSLSSNVSKDVYSTTIHSFTHNTDNQVIVSREYLGEKDKILIIDDFLANGCALEGLIKIVEEAGASLIGCFVAIEKGFQHGGDLLREKGYRIEALALNLTVLSNDINRGVAWTKNRFLEAAKGEWVHIHDSDDRYFADEMLARDPKTVYSGIMAYHYNFPREGSLFDLQIKGLLLQNPT